MSGHHPKLIQQFWSSVTKTIDCWIFPRRQCAVRYDAGGRQVFTTARRLAWELAFGPVKRGLFVQSTCKNNRCVRAEHLFLSGSPRPRPDPEARFWARVNKGDGTGCWEYRREDGSPLGLQPGKNHSMYGSIKVGTRDVRANRYSWEIHFGPIPSGLMVCHHCDNPPCVRPDHLFLGVAANNTADMVRKGRARGPSNMRGEAGTGAKLTADQVRDIRRRYAAGELQIHLAPEFGVSQAAISAIVLRQTWAHLEQEEH